MAEFLLKKLGWSVDYAVTITLKPKMRRLNAEEQFARLAHYFVNHWGVNKGIKATLIAELHKSYDVHLHGIISINLDSLDTKYLKRPMRYVHDMFRKSDLVGYVVIKQVEHYNIWCEYIMKGLGVGNEVSEAIGAYPTILDDYKIDDQIIRSLNMIKANAEHNKKVRDDAANVIGGINPPIQEGNIQGIIELDDIFDMTQMNP